jgi:hypothetical protein
MKKSSIILSLIYMTSKYIYDIEIMDVLPRLTKKITFYLLDDENCVY